jgi:hypothetical protein
MAGVNLQRVQQLLGHKSYQTTLRYAHMAPDQGKDAVEKLCEVVATGHYTVTGAPRSGDDPLRAAANDGTPAGYGAGDRTRTGNLRLMKPPL